MNKVFAFLFLICIAISSCTTSKSVVSKNTDLSKYEYAFNDTYQIPTKLIEYEIQLYDAVESSRLEFISERQINELTPQQQSKLLLVKYGISQKINEVIVTVNFIDYMTGRPVASCRGAFGLGLDYSGDLKGAIKRVAKQIAETFPK
ncbi:MAG: hypothetical protein BHV79_16245 [Bacteroides uniformis]|uniref:DUF4136 domain-containing protein n=1 Tax=Bacteroides uniformis TaxID=820 RepID=A0A1Q6HUX0_BACUN|nr:MAG: hypothetical protein BHV79_16245 [Bacteroides uniformis]